MKVLWLRTALRNLDDEAQYVARDDPAAARQLVRRIAEAVERLAQYPESGRAGRIAGTRELVVTGTPYIHPYRVNGGAVQILRVLHGSRRYPPVSRG